MKKIMIMTVWKKLPNTFENLKKLKHLSIIRSNLMNLPESFGNNLLNLEQLPWDIT